VKDSSSDEDDFYKNLERRERKNRDQEEETKKLSKISNPFKFMKMTLCKAFELIELLLTSEMLDGICSMELVETIPKAQIEESKLKDVFLGHSKIYNVKKMK